jgi:hypothetical protein
LPYIIDGTYLNLIPDVALTGDSRSPMSHLALSTFGALRVALDDTPITSFATDK